jgi:thiamine-monophosphate kinase
METTPVSKLGEFGLIEYLTKDIQLINQNIIKGVGDDCAVIEKNADTFFIISTDILAEGIHFDLMYTPLKHLGYKSVIANLSDVYAMNGKPLCITVSMAISSKYSVEAINEIYDGIKAACKNYQVDLVGGDTTSSLKGMFISITAIGEVKKEKICYRKGAKPNDLICCSGDLGAAFMGLQLLEREKKIFLEHPKATADLENQQYILQRQLKPEARKDIIEILEKKNIEPTSMIDISDGLSSEINHICKQSNCGGVLYEEKIPVHSDTYEMAVKMGIDPVTAMMNGGEDYELLFTISQADYEKIKDENDISIIGHITENAGVELITKKNNKVKIEAAGWVSFHPTEKNN